MKKRLNGNFKKTGIFIKAETKINRSKEVLDWSNEVAEKISNIIETPAYKAWLNYCTVQTLIWGEFSYSLADFDLFLTEWNASNEKNTHHQE